MVDVACPTDEWEHYGELCLYFEPNDAESWDDASGISHCHMGHITQ